MPLNLYDCIPMGNTDKSIGNTGIVSVYRSWSHSNTPDLITVIKAWLDGEHPHDNLYETSNMYAVPRG